MTLFKTIAVATLSLLLPACSHSTTTKNKISTEIWASKYGKPNITVRVKNNMVTVKNTKKNPKVKQNLQYTNSLLLNRFSKKYIKIRDYTSNGYNDIAIMKGAGYGGNNRCYKIYPYQPLKMRFDKRSQLTVCR